MNPLRRALIVACGAFLGGAFRIALTAILPVAADDPALVAPALLVVNVSGSLLAGFIRGLVWAEERNGRNGRYTEALEAAMVVGFCGGYTSYSAFVAMLHEGFAGALPWSFGLAIATIALCPLAAAIGMRATGGYPPRPASQAAGRAEMESA